MNTSLAGRKRSRGPMFGEAPTEKVKTLSDDQLKKLLDKQLITKTSLSDELNRKPNLTCPVVTKDESCASTGLKSLSQFQMIAEEEKQISLLRACALTEEEIKIQWNVEKYGEKYASDQLKGSITLAEYLQRIQRKIRNHEEDLLKPNRFADCVDVSRREFETENARTDRKFSYLIKLKEKEYKSNDPVCVALKEYEENIKKIQKDDDDRDDDSDDDHDDDDNDGDSDDDDGDDNDDNDDSFIGPQLCSINERVDIIAVEEVVRNRLCISDIHKMEHFKDYKAGEPCQVLYIKNLSKNISEKDLAKLFARYYVKGTSDIEYKVMKGRMHGQAFVTFKDRETAEKALLLSNGYILNEKPMIVSYGKTRR